MEDDRKSHPKIFYQIGAPALIHHEKITKESAFLHVPGYKYPTHCSHSIAEHIQRKNRLATRWNYVTADIPPINTKKSRHFRAKTDTAESGSISTDLRLQDQRCNILLHHQVHPEVIHEHIVRTYNAHDKPYAEVNYVQRPKLGPQSTVDRTGRRAMRLGKDGQVDGLNVAIQRHETEDPAYLAPFGLDALHEAKDDSTAPDYTVDKRKREGTCSWRGNCLLCLPCPCPNCSEGDPSWCLFHPKGHLMDTLCVSNVIAPNSRENAGHFFPVSKWQEVRYVIRQSTVSACKILNPNEICLDDTILEIEQAGKWSTGGCRDGTFIVRTTSYISVIGVSVSNPSEGLLRHPLAKRRHARYDESMCWGNYILREKQRIDLRSLALDGSPSYRPIAVTCHPRYGNDFTDPKFAFLSYAEHSGEQNTIHLPNGDCTMMHPISSLSNISAINFSKTHPMCLWSAASSHVRPTLVSEIWYKNQYPLGFGTSLFYIDLRNNSSTFQWSPSAEEMKQEGTYSISELFMDWNREHCLWVSSRSAGKTWELDSRMPCRAVHSWSLGFGCDIDSTSFPERGPYGDAVLLTKVKDSSLGDERQFSDTNLLLSVDTTPNAFGFQVLQRPQYEPRFQTKSLECVAVPQMNFTQNPISIATTSVFAMPERDDDLYICGIASFRTSIREYIPESEVIPPAFESTDHVLCTLTMNNHGDIYCHSLLETTRHVPECRSFPGLPPGVATIPVSPNLNGRTKDIEHKRWKPTGGMNLKTFWTNQYPVGQNARPLIHPTITKGVLHPRKKAKQHKSTKLGKEQGRFEIPMPQQSGNLSSIALGAPNESRLLNRDGKPLVIPQSSVDKALEIRLSFRRQDLTGSFGVKEDVTNGSTTEAIQTSTTDIEETMPRSDLNPSTLQKASDTWELWNQLDSESSSSDDDDNEAFVHMAI